MKRVFTLNVARLATAAVLSALALSGCGGGADTRENAPPPPNAGANYSGPPAATDDIQNFSTEFWDEVSGPLGCGNCHNAGGQSPQFARTDDVNLAYQAANPLVNRETPSQSAFVLKVGGGHNCWLSSPSDCASILTRLISNWIGAEGTGGRQIELVAPPSRDPGQSRRFPATPAQANFGQLYGLLDTYCSNCHQSDAATAQSPYFASDDINEAYLAAIPKINLDDPAQSRFFIRLDSESHNCWSNCDANAQEILTAITAMQTAIQPSAVDPNLVVSKALTLYDGTVASGGNRYENHLIALYEFKTGQGPVAFDTSGVAPAADLRFNDENNVSWVGGWGINIRTGGKAQASTTASRKFHQLITATGEYTVEAWVVPGNVTQEDARIVSYSGSQTARNFTLGQTMYNYDFFGRSSTTGTNGTPALSTADADERLQSSLQHVVLTYDPVNGRRIYVNGEFTGDLDPSDGGTLGDWDNSFALVLGSEVDTDPDTQWVGVIRMVAIHNRAMTLEQVRQNFDVGVGQKFFLLFGVEHIVNVPRSYIMFEAAEYDSSGYLFTTPKFISLDADARPGSIPLRGMRIGLNGAEPSVGQAYRLLDLTISDASYSPSTGQTLSSIGTIIGREQGPVSDEFFLCFDQLGSRSNVCSTFATAVSPPVSDSARPSDIGVRTFDEINATFSKITGVSPTNTRVRATYASVRQSLPAVPSIEAFLSSHQTSVAQLALQYCSAAVDDATARAGLFDNANFNTTLSSQGERDALINPLVSKAVGNAATQDAAATATELNNLINRLCTSSACGGQRTLDVAKAACGAALGNAATLVK